MQNRRLVEGEQFLYNVMCAYILMRGDYTHEF